VIRVERDGVSERVAVVGGDERCDVWLLDRLLRLHLEARRSGGTLRLSEVDDGMRDLARFAGVAGILGLDPPGATGTEVDRAHPSRGEPP